MQDYIVRESPRAKRVLIKLSPREGLVVVVPRGFDHDRIPALVREKNAWIERKTAELEARRVLSETEPPDSMPTRLLLRGLGEEWAVAYLPGDSPSPRTKVIEGSENILLMSGRPKEPYECAAALRPWLGRKTHQHIKPWMADLAEEHSFAFNRVFVRAQKTRWASCSSHLNISLNLKLLFLPQDLVHYVLLHELCHTVHLNHSREFWSLLGRCLPDYAGSNKSLRDAWRYVPAWLD
jgi:predicted metal-dependent hydrolase